MAIAPLPQIEELEESDLPWPRPHLTLVGAQRRTAGIDPAPIEPIRPSVRPATTERRRPRASARIHRRRLVAALGAVALVVVLALPLTATGTVTVSGQATPGGTPAGLMDGTVYAVQPGDTLASIAHRINPAADQRALVAQMAREVGSSVVVSGEHVLLP